MSLDKLTCHRATRSSHALCSRNGWRLAVREAKLATTEAKLAAILASEEPKGTPALHPRQDVETPLLGFIKTLVQRRQSISVASECNATNR